MTQDLPDLIARLLLTLIAAALTGVASTNVLGAGLVSSALAIVGCVAGGTAGWILSGFIWSGGRRQGSPAAGAWDGMSEGLRSAREAAALEHEDHRRGSALLPGVSELRALVAGVEAELTKALSRIEAGEVQVQTLRNWVQRLDEELARGAPGRPALQARHRASASPAPPVDAATEAEPDALSCAARWVADPVSLRTATEMLVGLRVMAARCDGEYPDTRWVLREVPVDAVPEAFFVQVGPRGDAWLVPNHPTYALLARFTTVRGGTVQLNRMVRAVVQFPRGRLTDGRFEPLATGVVDLDR